MASVNTVQRGSVTVAANAASNTATITAVDTAKSILLFTVRVTGNQPDFVLFNGVLTNSTTLTFTRIGSTGAPAATINWQVIEFTSGVNVYRGVAAHANNTTTNVTLGTAVNLDAAFPLISWNAAGTSIGENDYLKAYISTTTNLQILSHVAGASGGSNVAWQVVEFTSGATVRTGTAGIGGLGTSTTASIFPALSVLSNAWLVYSFHVEGGTGTNVGDQLITGRITNTTTITFERFVSGPFGVYPRWYLIEFSDGTTVQRGQEAIPAGTAQADVTVAAVATDKTAVMAGGGNLLTGKQRYVADDNPGYSQVTADLTSTTNLRLTRAVS